MNYEELYTKADNAMMQYVIADIDKDIKEWGDVWGTIASSGFDAVKFESNFHYNDEYYENILNSMTLYLNNEPLDEDVDNYDLIYELGKKYPRLIELCGKVFYRQPNSN